jgi:hypothetical protein
LNIEGIIVVVRLSDIRKRLFGVYALLVVGC